MASAGSSVTGGILRAFGKPHSATRISNAHREHTGSCFGMTGCLDCLRGSEVGDSDRGGGRNRDTGARNRFYE
jgi:hypothetical protein